jgi:outer membrane lipoprotein SlyB
VAVGEGVGLGADQAVRTGTIVAIESVELESDAQLGLGTVLGAAAGGVLGHQIGSGGGQDVATVLGVIGGALAGNVIEKKYLHKKPGQRISVRLAQGATAVITQEADSRFKLGDAVRIEGSGPSARVRLR